MDELRQFNQEIVDAFDVKQTGMPCPMAWVHW
jgi:hypothetical protein